VAAVTDRPWAGRRLHLVGLGGAGMSGYARVAVALGARVSGSDRADSVGLAALRDLGVEVHVGHDAANVPAGDGVEVFHSTAIPLHNPERVAAHERGLADRPRADLLEQISRLKRTIAVAGAHGKTTTTSMIAHALLRCGMQPAYLIGGALRTTGLNADWGAGEWLVVEADESDRSMLELHIEVAVVTNVELDHHATYGSLAEVREVFRAFLAGVPEAVLWDRPDVLALRASDAPRVAFDAPDPVLEAGASRFVWREHEVRLSVPGAHNARNAAAALEACRLAGADPAAAVAGLADFAGAGRRFERLGTTPSGAAVVDDYAHHPTEVAATIAAARTLGHRRVVAVFQPHLYSRTQRLAAEFGAALALADVAAVLDVYPARERAEDFPGVSGLTIAEAVADAAPGKTVIWLPDFDAAERVLCPRLRDGDLCLVLGAGNVDALGRRLVGGG
jgi:UDP-N-acetylmuramate--alanine ligase